MPPTLAQAAAWPGVLAVETLAGTISHGITPSLFTLVTYPQAARPAEYGALLIGDGFRRVALRDCKVVSLTGQMTEGGQVWVMQIADRRWRWQFGTISGRYNQADPRGKLVPWSIRSPEELARLCLKAMGENPATYKLQLPPGLPAAAGADVDKYLALGENFPQSFANPEVIWDNTTPAQALARLADLFQCRVIFQPGLDRVLVAPLGRGRPLPPGPCEVIAPAVNAPAIPRSVGVVGAPIRWQFRALLEPVAKEWDDSYRPANEVSYRPTQGWRSTTPPTFSGVLATDRLSYQQAVDLAQQSVFRCFRIRNVDPEQPLAKGPLAVPKYGKLKRRHQLIIQETKVEQVRPKPRDNPGQAIDAGLGLSGPAFATGAGVQPEFYNGYSRDQKASAYGRVQKNLVGSSVFWYGPQADQNTRATDKVRVPFTIDPVEQLVIFNSPLYRWDVRGDGSVIRSFPSLVLETSYLVTDATTGAVVRFEQSRPVLGGVGPPEWETHEDCQIGMVAEYTVIPAPSLSQPDDRHKLTGSKWFDLDEATKRADYYLAAMVGKYQLTGGGTNQYVGILPIDPDGFIQQVTWSIGAAGPTTIASGNSEHSSYVLPYPARRKAENLAPNAAAAAANLREREAAKALAPTPPGAVRG